MTATTFKFYQPNGDCHRVSYDSLPDLSTVNEFIDGVVGPGSSSESRQISYVDSEGDRIIIASSTDLREAAKDASESGIKTVKIQIRPAPRGAKQRQEQAKAGGRQVYHRVGPFGLWTPHYRAARRTFGSHCRDPFYRAHGDVVDSFNDLADLFDVLFSPCSTSSGSEKKADGGEDKSGDSAAAEAQSPDQASSSPRQEEDVAAPSGEDQHNKQGIAEPSSTDSTAPEDSTAAEVGDNLDIDGKARLLRDMGFDIPSDVAKKMIAEMGGRMDLIVRALVANNK